MHSKNRALADLEVKQAAKRGMMPQLGRRHHRETHHLVGALAAKVAGASQRIKRLGKIPQLISNEVPVVEKEKIESYINSVFPEEIFPSLIFHSTSTPKLGSRKTAKRED